MEAVALEKIKFHTTHIPKIQRLLEDTLRGKLPVKVASDLFRNVFPSHIIYSVSDFVSRMYKEEMEELLENLKSVEVMEDMAQCVKCGKPIQGAALMIEQGPTHVFCESPNEIDSKEEKMGKKKTITKGKTPVSKKDKATKKVVRTSLKRKTADGKDIPTVSSIVYDGITKKLTYEQIEKNVKKVHPESKFNKKHHSWYIAQGKSK